MDATMRSASGTFPSDIFSKTKKVLRNIHPVENKVPQYVVIIISTVTATVELGLHLHMDLIVE